MVKKKLSVHFIGIGGIGMSALARYYKAQKWAVSGSDLAATGITRELQKEGINVKIGHKKGNLPKGAELVIYSQAIKPDNPELKEAGRLSIPALSYPEAIGQLTKKYKTIAIAGAHGKSTTTALVSLILMKAGLDPTVIVGTNLKEFGNKNFRRGRGEYLVLEADEYSRAFLHYSPTVAIVTNIDREHLDTYKNLANIKKVFLQFLAKTAGGGALILNLDSLLLFSQRSKIQKIARKRNLKVFWYSIRSRHSPTFANLHRILKIPGAHNISNAMAAFALGKVLNIPGKKILSAIGSYRGAWRRMEYRGKFSIFNFQFSIFDDYAHHPTEIKATLAAFREKFPHSPIICVFQPHQAKRLAGLFKEFQHAFDLADVTLVLPLYKVPGRDEKITYDSEALVRAIKARYPNKKIYYLADPHKIKRFISKKLVADSWKPEAALVMMGAGDIVNYTNALLKD